MKCLIRSEIDITKKKIITRVSGVKYNDQQNFFEMEKLWKNLVNQVVFVNYNRWENIYIKEANNIVNPCSGFMEKNVYMVGWQSKSL